MRINENWGPGNTGIASGWVEMEECIKFPVVVRSYLDKKENKEKMFISYPQQKTEQGYEPIVSPSDTEVQREIEQAVFESMKKSILKGIDLPPVTDVTLTMSKEGGETLAAASIKVAGISIRNIQVREGRDGIEIKMPQHPSKGGYKDTVYGTNEMMRYKMEEAIREAYEAEREKNQEEEVELVKKSQPARTVSAAQAIKR